MQDYAENLTKDLQSIKSTEDFCNDWKNKWRNVAIAAQAILSGLYKPGGIVLGFLIGIADNFCTAKTKS